MNEKNDFALVPRPESALEKVVPGANRILSGMIADTLALAKKEPPAKRVFRVLTCTWDPLMSENIKNIIQLHLAQV